MGRLSCGYGFPRIGLVDVAAMVLGLAGWLVGDSVDSPYPFVYSHGLKIAWKEFFFNQEVIGTYPALGERWVSSVFDFVPFSLLSLIGFDILVFSLGRAQA